MTEQFIEIKRLPTSIRSKAEQLDTDNSGFLEHDELIKSIEQLVEFKRANYVLKWMLVALVVSLLLSIAAIAGCVFVIVDQQKDTTNTNGALSDRDSGNTLRTSGAQFTVHPLPSSLGPSSILENMARSNYLAPAEYISLLSLKNTTTDTLLLLEEGYDAYDVPSNLTNFAKGIRILGTIPLSKADELCAFFNEGYKSVMINFGSHQNGMTSMQGDLFNTMGCSDSIPGNQVFSILLVEKGGATNLLVECHGGNKDCTVVSSSMLGSSSPDYDGGDAVMDGNKGGRRLLEEGEQWQPPVDWVQCSEQNSLLPGLDGLPKPESCTPGSLQCYECLWLSNQCCCPLEHPNEEVTCPWWNTWLQDARCPAFICGVGAGRIRSWLRTCPTMMEIGYQNSLYPQGKWKLCPYTSPYVPSNTIRTREQREGVAGLLYDCECNCEPPNDQCRCSYFRVGNSEEIRQTRDMKYGTYENCANHFGTVFHSCSLVKGDSCYKNLIQ